MKGLDGEKEGRETFALLVRRQGYRASLHRDRETGRERERERGVGGGEKRKDTAREEAE